MSKTLRNGWGRGLHGSTTGEAQWPIGLWTAGRESPYPVGCRWTIGRRRGRMGMQNGGQQPGLRHRGARVEMWAGNATEGHDRRPAPGYGRPQPHVGHGQMISRHLSGLSCSLERQTEVAAFALPGRCSGVTSVISARQQKHPPPAVPYHLDTPLSIVPQHLCQWCIAKTGGGYTQTGVAKGLKVPCLFMITEVSIHCQKNPGGWYTPYTRVYPPIHH